jgi:hypothetical protein
MQNKGFGLRRMNYQKNGDNYRKNFIKLLFIECGLGDLITLQYITEELHWCDMSHMEKKRNAVKSVKYYGKGRLDRLRSDWRILKLVLDK